MSLFRPAKPTLTAGDRLEIAGHPVVLKVNARARRVSLRVDRVGGHVVATAPRLSRLPEAVAFARERADWIAAQMGALPAAQPLAPGDALCLFGQPIVLAQAPGRARLDPLGRLVAPGEGEAWRAAVVRTLKRAALAGFTERTEAVRQRLGQPPLKVAVADPRARWGSCRQAVRGAPAQIRYNWRVALAPPEVVDYLVAHECAHLIEANHGPRFWAIVDELVGDHRRQRAWLKREGAGLHAIG
ncbi:MAG: M48 family metallopeptidase [Caulobacterales bacterium]|nr:M48 family metallopeptidase [Caulobacterales bacterium]